MIVKCLACGRVMIAGAKHPGFQVCGCKNETMADNVTQNNTNVKGE